MWNFMIYAVAFSAALSVVGLCLEHVAAGRRQPRRLAWLLAMLCSTLFPPMLMMKGKVQPAAPVMAQAAAAQSAAHGVATVTATDFNSVDVIAAAPAVITPAPKKNWSPTPPSDRSLLTAWASISGALLLFLTGAGLVLRYRSATWQRASIHGNEMLVSDDTGPALFGVLRPKIVVPRWFMDEPADTQMLVLAHEQQHIRTRDPLLLHLATLLAVAMPWNLPMWWQLRRLRLAIELDCDARVMRGGAEASRYGRALLGITQRAVAMPVGVIAMSEPVSALEHRIRNLAPLPVRHAMWRLIGAMLIGAAGVSAAAALDAPQMKPAARAPASQPAVPATPAARAAPATPATPVSPATRSTVAATSQQGQQAGTPTRPGGVEQQNQEAIGDCAAARLWCAESRTPFTSPSGSLSKASGDFSVDVVTDKRVNADGTPVNPATYGKPICRVTGDHVVLDVDSQNRMADDGGLMAALRKTCTSVEMTANSVHVRRNAAEAVQQQAAGKQMDLRELIASVGEMYRKHFIVNPRVMGTIDLGNVNPDLISYHAFLEILGVHGFVAVPSEDVVTIIPAGNARSAPSPIVDGAGHIAGDESEVVTVVIPVTDGTTYMTSQMVASLRSLVADWGYINAAPDGKSVMLVDTVANARRIVALLNSQSKAR